MWHSLSAESQARGMAGACTHVSAHVGATNAPRRALAAPRRVVLSTAALSNELWSCLPASVASSLTWWRRWGHAEVALYPHKPTQVSCLLILTRSFSTVGSGEACRGQLQIVRNTG